MRTAVKYTILFLFVSVFLTSCGREKAETVLLDSGEEEAAERDHAEGEDPAEDAVPTPSETPVIQVVCSCNCAAGQDSGTAAAPDAAEASAQPADPDGGKVNINTADAARLQTLNGIGATRAQDIISYREANGTFQSIEDIKNVPGIKDGIYSKIKDDISV